MPFGIRVLWSWCHRRGKPIACRKSGETIRHPLWCRHTSAYPRLRRKFALQVFVHVLHVRLAVDNSSYKHPYGQCPKRRSSLASAKVAIQVPSNLMASSVNLNNYFGGLMGCNRTYYSKLSTNTQDGCVSWVVSKENQRTSKPKDLGAFCQCTFCTFCP